jgi:hypothetical protein
MTEKLCGNCNSIRYAATKELTLLSGRCARASVSDRIYVRCDEEACEHFTKRTKARVASDERRRKELEEYVASFNQSARRKK